MSDMQTVHNDIYATFPNVKDERDKPLLASEKPHYLGEKLMAKLVRLYPHYIFELRNANPNLSRSSLTLEYARVDVQCRGEHLGRMYFKSGWYQDDEVWLTNKRLRTKMSRANKIKTTKLDRAVKEFKKYFKPLSLRERIAGLQKEVEMQIGREMSTLIEGLEELLGVAKLFKYYSPLTIGRLVVLLEDEGVDEEIILRARGALEELQTVGPIFRSLPVARSHPPPRPYSPHKAVLFYITPDKDYCQVKGWSKEPDLSVYKEHEVLPKYKTAIGILKMLDNKTFVANIGYKVNANTFYILDTGDKDASFGC